MVGRRLLLAAVSYGRAAARAPSAFQHVLSTAAGKGGGAAATPSAAVLGSNYRWAAALAACLGVGAAGVHLLAGSDSTAGCEAASQPPDAGAPLPPAGKPKQGCIHGYFITRSITRVLPLC